MAKILFIVAQNKFRDEEFFYPRDILKSHEQEVASLTTGTAKGVLGGEIKPDLTIEAALKKVKDDFYEAVIFVGGPGATVYFTHHAALDIAKAAAESDNVKVLGAICIAPMILAHAGVLDGKSVTCWDDDKGTQQKIIESKGARFVAKDVVVDGKLVTANGPQSAKKFGEKIFDMLK
ncbi:MAG: DJ-1/PfpI family protein [Candidatus Woesearchaeota archaeon]